MVARPVVERAPSAPAVPSEDAIDFVKFCYERRKVGWPELYDEMCAVAGRGLFRDWGPEELAAHGIGFTLFEMPALAVLVTEIVTEDRAQTRARRVVASAAGAPAG